MSFVGYVFVGDNGICAVANFIQGDYWTGAFNAAALAYLIWVHAEGAGTV